MARTHPTPAAHRHFFWMIILVLLANCGAVFAQSAPVGTKQSPVESAAPGGRSNPAENHKDTNADSDRPSLLTPLRVPTDKFPYSPITPRQRLRWLITNTIGPPHLVTGVFLSGFGTAVDGPEEYGPHWGGFADRYGMRMTGIATGNAIEAGAGLLLREDPRYFRAPDRSFKARMKNVMKLTFAARDYDGDLVPAYGRYAAIFGNNFLSNTWRVHSEANTQDALLRSAEGFAGRMFFNAVEEFWPDVKRCVFHKSTRSTDLSN
jgi:hypothetical protein